MKREIVKTLTQTYPNSRKKLVLQVYDQAEEMKTTFNFSETKGTYGIAFHAICSALRTTQLLLCSMIREHMTILKEMNLQIKISKKTSYEHMTHITRLSCYESLKKMVTVCVLRLDRVTARLSVVLI